MGEKILIRQLIQKDDLLQKNYIYLNLIDVLGFLIKHGELNLFWILSDPFWY